MDPFFAPGCSMGRVLKRHDIEGFTLSETSYPSGFKAPRHSHEQPFFYTVLEGAYTDVFGDMALTSSGAGLIYHPAGETHSHYTHASEVRCFNLDLGPHWLERAREVSLRLDSPAELHGGTAVALIHKLYSEFRAMEDMAALAMEGLALEILVLASRHAMRSEQQACQPWLKQARDLLHAEFMEKRTMAQVADAVGVHPVHLARVFRQHYGCTLADYVRQIRIEAACRQLTQTDTPLVMVALETGFADQSQFTRTFKRIIGMTPGAYRIERQNEKTKWKDKIERQTR